MPPIYPEYIEYANDLDQTVRKHVEKLGLNPSDYTDSDLYISYIEKGRFDEAEKLANNLMEEATIDSNEQAQSLGYFLNMPSNPKKSSGIGRKLAKAGIVVGLAAGAFALMVSGGVIHESNGNLGYNISHSLGGPFPDFQGDLSSEVALRNFPYPYHAGFTIASDCDKSTRETFRAVHQFLNTKENTSMGQGVGLEIADSFFMYSTMKDEMTYYIVYSNGEIERSNDAGFIEAYLRAGYIDSMHSFGSFEWGGFTREMGIRALEEMKDLGVAPTIYMNHGPVKNIQNIGNKWRNYFNGDNISSIAYHTDKSIYPNGPFRFLWKSDETSQVGYDPIETVTLTDGRTVNAFKRYIVRDNKTQKASWHLDSLDKQISDDNLNKLIASEKYLIVGNHLGYIPLGYSYPPIFDKEDVAALRNLEKRYEDGSIYVTTTSKLLNYALVHDNLDWTCKGNKSRMDINVLDVNDPAYGKYVPTEEDLQGITFYIPHPERTYVNILGRNITDLERNPPDYKGRMSVSVPLRHLPPLPELE